MAPSPPRLRILSGEQFFYSKLRNVSITVDPFFEARLHPPNSDLILRVMILPFSTWSPQQ